MVSEGIQHTKENLFIKFKWSRRKTYMYEPQTTHMHEIVVLVILFMVIKGTTNISSIPTDL